MKGRGRESVGAAAEVTASKRCAGNTQEQGEGVNGKRKMLSLVLDGKHWEGRRRNEEQGGG